MRVRALEALPFGHFRIGGVILTQLCCARVHFAYKLCLVTASVKGGDLPAVVTSRLNLFRAIGGYPWEEDQGPVRTSGPFY
jgi:hypothetical protein